MCGRVGFPLSFADGEVGVCQVLWCLSKSCLCYWSDTFLVLCLKRADFTWGLFGICCWCFGFVLPSWFGIFEATINTENRNPRELPPSPFLAPQFSNWSAFFSSQNIDLCVLICSVQGFELYVVEVTGESTSLSWSRKCKSPNMLCKK